MNNYENFVQCRVYAPIAVGDTTVYLYAAEAPYNLPPLGGGYVVLVDSPGRATKAEIIKYTSRNNLTLNGVTRGQSGTTAQAWVGTVYCYQSLMAEDLVELSTTKATLLSPKFTGVPTVPTAVSTANSTQIANTAFVKTAIAALVAASPAALDTLKELAAALNNDPNFATTMVAELGKKVDKEAGKSLSANDFTTVLLTKLNGIATSATKNQTDAYLLDRTKHTGAQPTSTITGLDAALGTKVDKVTDKGLSTNDYTTVEKTKLTGIAVGATKNRTDVATDSLINTREPKVTGKGLSTNDYTDADRNKLNAIAASATANATDAQLRDRATHTGTQPVDTITGLGNAATHNYGAAVNTVMQGNDPRVLAAAAKSYVDTELGKKVNTTALGNVAGLNIGTTAGTVVAGNDARILAAATKSYTDAELAKKVSITVGKDLSTNDYTTAEKSKLSGIATAATANATDASLLARANHTGTQSTATIAGLDGTLVSINNTLGTKADKSKLGNAAGHNYGTAASTVMQGNDARVLAATPNGRSIISGTGLSGGGDLTADRTLSVKYGTTSGTAAQGNDSRIVNASQNGHNHDTSYYTKAQGDVRYAYTAGTESQDFAAKEVSSVTTKVRGVTGTKGVKLEYDTTTNSLNFNFY